MAGPQTTREALMAELLGDVGALLDRIEALQVAMPGVADASASAVFLAGEDASKKITASAEAFVALMAQQRDLVAKPISEAADSISQSADLVDTGARRIATMATLAGMAGGVIGGLLAGIAAASFFMT